MIKRISNKKDTKVKTNSIYESIKESLKENKKIIEIYSEKQN